MSGINSLIKESLNNMTSHKNEVKNEINFESLHEDMKKVVQEATNHKFTPMPSAARQTFNKVKEDVKGAGFKAKSKFGTAGPAAAAGVAGTAGLSALAYKSMSAADKAKAGVTVLKDAGKDAVGDVKGKVAGAAGKVADAASNLGMGKIAGGTAAALGAGIAAKKLYNKFKKK